MPFKRLIYPIINLNFIGFFKYYKPESKVVVISSLLTTKKFLSESICWEIGFINALIERKKLIFQLSHCLEIFKIKLFSGRQIKILTSIKLETIQIQ